MSKKRSGLGKGVDALFSAEGGVTAERSGEDDGKSSTLDVGCSEVEDNSSKLEVSSSDVDVKSSKSDVGSSEVEGNSSVLEDISYNHEVMEIAIKEADKNPRITLWSPVSAAMLKYLRKTIPEFSISEEAGNLLEEAIITKYPELYRILENGK